MVAKQVATVGPAQFLAMLRFTVGFGAAATVVCLLAVFGLTLIFQFDVIHTLALTIAPMPHHGRTAGLNWENTSQGMRALNPYVLCRDTRSWRTLLFAGLTDVLHEGCHLGLLLPVPNTAAESRLSRESDALVIAGRRGCR